jgi:prevent-host-death family protein
MKQVNVSEFKAICLRLLEDVRQTGQPIEILKSGKPLAVVHPPPVANRKAAFGALRSSLAAPVGDLVTPLDEREWEALRH